MVPYLGKTTLTGTLTALSSTPKGFRGYLTSLDTNGSDITIQTNAQADPLLLPAGAKIFVPGCNLQYYKASGNGQVLVFDGVVDPGWT